MVDHLERAMSDGTRRGFLRRASLIAAATAAAELPRRGPPATAAESPAGGGQGRPISFNLSVHPVEFIEDPDLGRLLIDSGIDKVWLIGWCYGQWSYDRDKLLEARKIAESVGLKTALINLPLGHPGNSLGAVGTLVPLTIPDRWRYRISVDEREIRHCGCLDDVSWEDNLKSIREARQMGFHEIFMDDDLRLSVGPGVIGGCFCPGCVDRFKTTTGATDADMDEVRRQVRGRIRGDELLRWLKFHGQRITAFLDECNAVAPDLSVGIMVMYMGCEQAGVDLDKVRNRPFRVGEAHFGDRSFGRTGGKLAELASSMFHVNQADPRLAYSESTAFPPAALSAENMGRKIAVPLMSGVQNVMFMSGIRLFPRGNWATLSRHIRRARDLSARLPPEQPAGALQLWFGPGARSVAESWPMVECLGMGIPAEVVADIGPAGVYLVQAEDVPHLPDHAIADPGMTIVTCRAPAPAAARCRWIDAGMDWPARWRAKEAILNGLAGVPHVVGTVPAAVRWYPAAGTLLVWNVNESDQAFDISCGGTERRLSVAAGAVDLIDT